MKIQDIKAILNQAGYITESEVSLEDSFSIGGINEKDIFITKEGKTIKITFNLDKKENILGGAIDPQNVNRDNKEFAEELVAFLKKNI